MVGRRTFGFHRRGRHLEDVVAADGPARHHVVGLDVAAPRVGLAGTEFSQRIVFEFADGEDVMLTRPDDPEALPGEIPYILVELVDYKDAAPWRLRPMALGHPGHPSNPSSLMVVEQAAVEPGSTVVITWQSASNQTDSLWRSTHFVAEFDPAVDSGILANPPMNSYSTWLIGADCVLSRIRGTVSRDPETQWRWRIWQ